VALERSVRWSQLPDLSRGDRVISVDHTRPNGNAYRPHHPMGRAVEDTSANPSENAWLKPGYKISEPTGNGTSQLSHLTLDWIPQYLIGRAYVTPGLSQACSWDNMYRPGVVLTERQHATDIIAQQRISHTHDNTTTCTPDPPHTHGSHPPPWRRSAPTEKAE